MNDKKSREKQNNIDNETLPNDYSPESSELASLSYRQLIWRRFRKNRMGIISATILISFYIIAFSADFFA